MTNSIIVVNGISGTSNANKISNISNAFNDISKKVLRANYPSKINNSPPSLEQILEVILSTNFNTNNTFTEDLLELLIIGCQTVNPADEALTTKFGRIIINFCKKHLVKLNDTSSGQSPVEIILSFLIKSFTNATQPVYAVGILRAMSRVLYENGQECKKLHDQLLYILLPLVKEDNKNLDIRRMAINCLGNLCYHTGNKFQGNYKIVYELLLASLNSPNPSDDESAYLKTISSTLRALQFIVLEDKSVLSEPFGSTIEIIKKYVFYNVDDIKKLQAEIDQSRIAAGNSVCNSSPSTQRHSRRHSRMKSIGRSVLSSDSEISDGEHTQSIYKRDEDSRIRANALGYLQSIAKVSSKLLYQYWSLFLPYTEPSDSSPPSLLTIITCEPTLTVRISACSVITTMIDSSKQYLAAADDREVKTSFTSLSAKLGTIVRELHAGLLQVISREDHNLVLTQLLKCCNVLASNMAYDRLTSGYLSRVYYTTANFLVHNENAVRLATMTLISTIMDCKTCIREVDKLLLAEIINSASANIPRSSFFQNYGEMSLLSYLVLVIGSKDQSPAMKIEAWGVLCACTRTHFNLVSPAWKHINPLIVNDLACEDEKIRTAAMTFLIEYAKEQAVALCGSSQNIDEDVMVQRVQKAVTSEVFQWWSSVFDQHIQSASIDKCHAVRALTCDLISHIPSDIEKRKYCIKILLGFSKDESPNVRASACRGLGVYILFPCLQQDTKFASDMALSVIQQMSDQNILVRIRSSWALGNLCDTIVLLSNPDNNQGISNNNTNLTEFLINVMWARIVKAGLAASNDKNEKVRPNGVRMLGSIIHVSPTNFLEREERGLIKDVVMTLIKNFETGTLKVRWNACYAAANMLRNPNFPIGLRSNNWSIPLYESLIKVVQTSKNFKVRINACLALSTPTTRAKYGGDTIMLSKILQAVVTSLENVDNLTGTGFSEVKYQEQLRNQLLNTYHHLINISSVNDKRFIESYIQRVNEWKETRPEYLDEQNGCD
ncbi:16614_t:CDS:10 [Funneliformis caledonium]|uniref:16614_t:CDS:1 n=1 Tax=Funneliformis caledonium TaxID=1117310 RepID=A0A9N9GL74_9GLOM|nr:16614_t:CDS:10 [Funneliformis caledonium]